jgi:hypothetical protein
LFQFKLIFAIINERYAAVDCHQQPRSVLKQRAPALIRWRGGVVLEGRFSVAGALNDFLGFARSGKTYQNFHHGFFVGASLCAMMAGKFSAMRSYSV